MQKSIKKIALLFFLILILPIAVFFIYQFAKLSESEKEINSIYFQQLETIIYSINQYSEDVVSNWGNEIKINFSRNSGRSEFNSFINENGSIKSIVFLDTLVNVKLSYFNSLVQDSTDLLDNVITIMKNNTLILERLKNFLEVDYQKTEALGNFSNLNLNLSIFTFKDINDNIIYCAIAFEPIQFVRENLVSKISQACGEKFIVSVINNFDKSIIHSCEQISVNEISLLKPLWLIPEFSLGIKMQSGSIEELVRERYYENLLVLGILLIILLTGVVLIYTNIRRELKLTQLKSDFISNVSHELRTPLSLISMYSETLVLGRLKNEQKKSEYYKVINNETNRLSKIVNTILNFSKMESGTRKYHFEKSNIAQISNDILATYDYHITSKGFTYSVKMEDNIENVFVDKDAVSESIINLIENAMKYSGTNKEFLITINQNEVGPYWEIEDFGIGISKIDQQKIFEKFYRVSSGLVHNTKGTGLGLSLVKQIMVAHDGEIIVKSKVGKGSIFRLQFNNKLNSHK